MCKKALTQRPIWVFRRGFYYIFYLSIYLFIDWLIDWLMAGWLDLFVCLFVYSFVCFYFNNLWTPTGSYTENFVNIRLDCAEIFRIKKCLFVCWFVCLFIDLFDVLFYSSWDTYSKLPWKFCEDPTWFGWDIQDLKHVCLFVCSFVCLLAC